MRGQLLGALLLAATTAHAGGGEYYLPRPDGACLASESSGELAAAEADFINNRGRYIVVNMNDQLYVFNQCNLGKAYCYRLPVVCGGTHVFVLWLWRQK